MTMSMVESSGAGLRRAEWRTSSRSQMSNCVEVTLLAGPADEDVVAVRDSKDATGPVLTFNQAGWREFVRGIRQGDYDLP
jgi:hypothetical protein